jgi:hypothetical protein
MEATEGVKNLYSVIQPFTAKIAISGRERKFLPGEDFECDPAKPGETITIEADELKSALPSRAAVLLPEGRSRSCDDPGGSTQTSFHSPPLQ